MEQASQILDSKSCSHINVMKGTADLSFFRSNRAEIVLTISDSKRNQDDVVDLEASP